MGLFDRFRFRQPQAPDSVEDIEEEELEPLPPLSMSELWPPTPRAKILYIGIAFFLFNLLLLCIFAIVFSQNAG